MWWFSDYIVWWFLFIVIVLPRKLQRERGARILYKHDFKDFSDTQFQIQGWFTERM